MMPILHLPGEMMPGQFGPISRVGLPCRNCHAFTISSVGMPSVMHTTSASPASVASMMASAANGGGTKITVALAPVSLAACATLAGHYAAHHSGAVSDGLLRVESPFLPRESLNDQSSISIYQYAHINLETAPTLEPLPENARKKRPQAGKAGGTACPTSATPPA